MKKQIKKAVIVAMVMIAATLATIQTVAQPAIQWQKNYGGTKDEYLTSFQQTSDGGFILSGYTKSDNGDMTSNYGGYDCWIAKSDSTGVLQWQKNYGGSGEDEATSVRQTSDGGYVFAGFTSSNNGDVSGNHGGNDYWVVKLDVSGNIQWQKCFGGTGDDEATAIRQTSDGGYIVAGYAASYNGDITGAFGGNDYWILKLDNNGNLQWEKSFGGTSSDRACAIEITGNGGYIIGGYSSSNNGYVSGNHGVFDYWIVKLQGNGTYEWAKSLGGSSMDYCFSVKQTADGGYVAAGLTYSNNGNVSGNHSSASDTWIVKLSGTGSIQWQKCLGGTNDEVASSVWQTNDGGYIASGASRSDNGNVSGNHGGADYWTVKLDAAGTMQWQKSIGGTSDDIVTSVMETTNDRFVLAGTTMSADGDVSANHGGYDIWLVKIMPGVFNTFKGTVFKDINNNGVKDNNETGVPNILLQTKGNGILCNTDSSGKYTAYSALASDTLKLINNNPYIIPTPAYFPVTISDSGKDFALYYISVNNLKITVTPLTVARRGDYDVIKLTFKNTGTQAMTGSITLVFDNIINFNYSSPAQAGINGNTITWNYANLLPLEQRNINVYFNIPTSVSVGTLLHFSAAIYPIAGDTAPADNLNSIEQPVIASCDPNNKSVLPGEAMTTQQLANGESLIYTVHFQNTGNDTAFKVVILDTISPDADATTFEILSSSHPCVFKIRGTGIVEFSFPGILLPDSNVNSIGSNGFVKYSVKPKPGLSVGNEINNTAYIYFDYNDAVITNTVTTTIINIVGSPEFVSDNFGLSLYPNPAKDELRVKIQSLKSQIQNSKGGRYFIYGGFGQLISEGEIKSAETKINVSRLAKGLYLLKVENENEVAVKRFVKE